MIEFVTDWTTAAGGGFMSVMYAGGETTAVVARSRWAEVLTQMEDNLSTDVDWSIRNEGRVMDAATGQVTDFWTDDVVHEGTGAVASTSVADATQVLLRWTTPDVKRGRRVQGRTFLPGLPVTAVLGGNLRAAERIDFAALAQAYAAFGSAIIWSRPTDTDPGSEHVITGGSVWSELAVLRDRRR